MRRNIIQAMRLRDVGREEGLYEVHIVQTRRGIEGEKQREREIVRESEREGDRERDVERCRETERETERQRRRE